MSARGSGPSELSRALDSIIGVDRDDDAYWNALPALRAFPPSELFHPVALLAHDLDPAIQALVPDILRGVPSLALRTIRLFRSMLSKHPAPNVIAAIGYAFRELDPAEAIDVMLAYETHAHMDVREALVHVLLASEDERAIAALIRLSCDEEAAIRDWATFGLGSQIEVDTFEIREALAARLHDPDPETRMEAIEGLANRGDPRADGK